MVRWLAPTGAAMARWARAERPVDMNRLAHDDGTIHLVDGALRLALVRILDERVALDEARPPVEVEVKVAYVAKVGELVVYVLLLRLLMNPCHEDDPALD